MPGFARLSDRIFGTLLNMVKMFSAILNSFAVVASIFGAKNCLLKWKQNAIIKISASA